MSHDNFQPPDVDVPPQDDEDRIYYALTDLAGLDTDDVNLRDHPKAYEVLDRLMTHAYAEGRNDAADEIARLQAQLDEARAERDHEQAFRAKAVAQVGELADVLENALCHFPIEVHVIMRTGLPLSQDLVALPIFARYSAARAALAKVGR